ncbi:MAG: helix-turn-helix transcriptional regulator [Rhodospirillales bacterium]|nr:helix-turn-helix domain-containing protein [Rhodospirillales bacterium]MDE2197409.1 helix-turn-helix transcriptional regulator [Rhodospirillales bacterium]MDE2575556.1 helix-turn-helix transcriptional regulator [Rhodospirillales bacterium]
MRFTEIGQQLRAYRLESGLRAEEIAARLGVSRAALYRYEKGEVIKLDTIQRLAELLKISPLSLLGIGVEYYSRPVGYLERIRQIEETADQILQVDVPVCFLTTTDAYDKALAMAFEDTAEAAGAERAALRVNAEQVLGILAARKRMYAQRKPGIIAMLPAARIRQFLELGVAPAIAVSDRTRRLCRQAAAAELTHIAEVMEAEPMGLQIGILPVSEPTGSFEILRARDRAMLSINPFRPDTPPPLPAGVAMITGADEAIAAHQRVAEQLWREALKGAAAAARLRELLSTSMAA